MITGSLLAGAGFGIPSRKMIGRRDGALPVWRLPLFWFWMAVLIPATTAAWGQDAELTFCITQEDDGSRFVAERLAKSAGNGALRLTLRETAGSMEKIERMAEGECDAAIVQLDALMVFSVERPKRLMIAPPVLLYEELLHLVCRRGSGFEDVGDLMNEPEGVIVLTGEPGSGSEATWRALSDLDRELEAVATRPLGGRRALDELLAGGPATCMVIVISPGAPFMRELDARGETLRLVSFDLFELRDAELVDNRVYGAAVIPQGTFRNLQDGLKEPAVETIGISATLVISRAWAATHPEPYQAVQRALVELKPLLRKHMETSGEGQKP